MGLPVHYSIHSKELISTVREICDGLYLSSTETVHYQLTVLEKEGLIKRKKDSPRAIQVVGYRFVKE